jgi:hypothetical protein
VIGITAGSRSKAGQAPAQGLLLNPGEYTVKVVPASGSPITQTVKIEADKTVIVK